MSRDWPSGDETIRTLSERSPKILLAFSRGKDSLASWLKLREIGAFDLIQPYYMYRIPGLSFEEESLDYYERFFGTRIVRMPHPATFKMLNDRVFQTGERDAVIDAANLPKYTQDDCADFVKKDCGLPAETFTAVGIRIQDSLARRAMLRKSGPIHEVRRIFYPVWDMNKLALIDLIKRHNVKLAPDYKYFSGTFESLTYRNLKPLKTHFPEDWKRLLTWFPHAEAVIFREETVRAK